MAVNTNGDTRHCLELGKHPEAFLKEAETPDLKVFLLWVIWIFLELGQSADWTKVLYANMLVDSRRRVSTSRQHCAPKTGC